MGRRFWLGVCGAFAAVLLSVSVLWARPGIVTTKDGQTIEGDVDNDSLDVVKVISKAGANITISRGNIASIEWTGEIDEEYHKRLAALPKDSGAQPHVELARWLFAEHAYDLERIEIETALKLEPNDPDANALFQTLVGQLRMERRTHMAATAKSASTGSDSSAVSSPAAGGDHPSQANALPKNAVLTPDQINIIRQYEWRDGDTTVKVRIDPDVRKEFLDKDAVIQPAVFNTLSPLDQAIMMIREGTPSVRKGVRVLSDPASMAEYRRIVQPLVISGCSAAGCHDASAPGGFGLATNTADDMPTAYTNFYALTTYTHGVEKTSRIMIDRTYPQTSLLLQYMLPAAAADVSHPQIPHGTPGEAFSATRKTRAYHQILDWMSKSLSPVNPDYGFVFHGPQPPTTLPSSDTH